MEPAVGAALVLAHHADRAEANLRIAADRPLVRRGRVDGDPVVLPPLVQEPGEQADGLGADAAALVGGAEEDVDARVPVHRVFLLVVLDAPGDVAVDLDHEQHARPVTGELRRDVLGFLGLTPPAGHRFLREDSVQQRHVVPAAGTDRDVRAAQHRLRVYRAVCHGLLLPLRPAQYVTPGNWSRARSSWPAHSRGQPKARAA